MMYGNDGWGWMVLMPLLWAVLIGLVVWGVLRLAQTDRSAGPVGRAHDESPREVLDRRFASGEIDGETYGRMRAQLTGRGNESSG